MHAQRGGPDGLALVSGTDGRTVWETTVIPSYEVLDFDARTGATLWESQDPMWPHAVVGDVFVDTATGRTITELDHPESFTSCDDDGHTLIVCAGKDDRANDDLVAIFRVDKRSVTTEMVDYHDLQVMVSTCTRC